MFTTLNKIREQGPCIDGWERLLRSLGKTKADDEPLSLLTVLDSNGLDDTLWCFRAVDGFAKEKQLFAVWCARQVQHLLTDPRSLVALDVAERFALGAATLAELDAAWDAAQAAWDAARYAAWDAAQAAQDAARYAAWDAAQSDAQEAQLRKLLEETRFKLRTDLCTSREKGISSVHNT